MIDSVPGHRPLSNVPIAYLVEETELNNDSTNHWLFTEECLRRLFQRSGWTVLARTRTGSREADQKNADGREFYLLESCHHILRSETVSARLLDGWHELEAGCYRWTAGQFSVEVRQPTTAERSSAVLLTFNVPPELFQNSAIVKIEGSHDGTPLVAETFEQPGIHTMRAPVNQRQVDPLLLSFSVTPFLRPGIVEKRELALQFAFSDSCQRAIRGVNI